MTFNCTLCLNSEEWLITSRFCSKCQRIKHLLNIYGDEVYITLEEVLVRTTNQQKNKIDTSIKPTIERNLEPKITKQIQNHYNTRPKKTVPK